MGKSSNFAPTGEEYSEGLAWCRQRLKDLKQPVMQWWQMKEPVSSFDLP